MQSRYTDIFPILEREAPELEGDANLIQQRLEWIDGASRSSQAEFALTWRHGEPPGSAQHTYAAVAATNPDIVNSWRTMEVQVCAKKLCALWPHIKPICNRYDIVFKPNPKQDKFHWKFPHQPDVRHFSGAIDAAALVMAEDAFPLPCPPAITTTEQCTAIVEDFFRNH